MNKHLLELLSAMAGESTTSVAHTIAQKLRTDADPSDVADALAACAQKRRSSSGHRHRWSWTTGAATLFGALSATFGLSATMDYWAPAWSSLSFIPLLSLPLLILGLWPARIDPWSREALAVEIAGKLRAVNVDDALALATAEYVADFEKDTWTESLCSSSAAVSLAIRLGSLNTSSGRPAYRNVLAVGAASILVITSFWIMYFLAMGQSAIGQFTP